MGRPVKSPGPDHPIEIREAGRPLRALCEGRVVAHSARALVMREERHPDVVYFPREDVIVASLVRSPTSSWCPYKGEASYFSLRSDVIVPDIAWSYETPLPAMLEIAGYVAFYASKVAVEDA
ncbi:MAG: DUF427 domain-containing protein [Beijerinckiaceae bacterium]